jgi:hypothetical protein
MMGAPSEVTAKQLRELHIRLDLPKKCPPSFRGAAISAFARHGGEPGIHKHMPGLWIPGPRRWRVPE